MIDYQQLAGQMEAAGVHARLQEPLSRHTTFRIGGPARLFCLPASENGLIAALELCRAAGCRLEIERFMEDQSESCGDFVGVDDQSDNGADDVENRHKRH